MGARHQSEAVEHLEARGEASVQRSLDVLAREDIVSFLRFLSSDEALLDNHTPHIQHFVRMGSFGDSELRVKVDTELSGQQARRIRRRAWNTTPKSWTCGGSGPWR